MNWQKEDIPNEGRLYRRIHKNDIDPADQFPIPGAYRELGDGDAKGMSSDWDRYSTPEEALIRETKRGVSKDPANYGIVELSAGDVRALDCLVLHDPVQNNAELADNRAHTNVRSMGGASRKEAQAKLRRASKWVLKVGEPKQRELPLVLPLIAIDGISGAGKSSTAKRVAAELGFTHIDTGAMYRLVTFRALQAGLRPDQTTELGKIAAAIRFSFGDHGELRADGDGLPPEIRSKEVSSHVSEYCKPVEVREALVQQQRALGRSRPSVLEGRDIGTVVFPDARWKFYMTANPETRAKRRVLELKAAGIEASEAEILENLQSRDKKDSTREVAPLRKAEGAREIDTSGLTLDEQVSIITSLVRQDLSDSPGSREARL